MKMRKETDELTILRKEVQRLKIALVDKTLAYDALEVLLEVAGMDREALKKHWVAAIGRCNEERRYCMSTLCKYFKISRNGYYKGQGKGG
ncbi:MAG: hypothetical protein LBD91_06915 [Prevotellaceae bacterium]|nr:hypothetical protein [Prevotellaceae bacterium]